MKAAMNKHEDWCISQEKNKPKGKFKGKKGTSFQQRESNSDDNTSVHSSASKKSVKKRGNARAKSPGRKPITCSNSKDGMCGFQGLVKPDFKEMLAQLNRLVGNKIFARLENTQFPRL